VLLQHVRKKANFIRVDVLATS